MRYTSFWRLHHLLEGKIVDVAAKVRGYSQKYEHGVNYSSPPTPNGIISPSIWFSIAICYFTGGSPSDIMVKFG